VKSESEPSRPRITGGDWRSRPLPGPILEGVRPTSSRVREALFNVVGQQLVGWSALDACGGSGLLAFEAFSRGARPVDVTEPVAARSGAIRKAAEQLGCALNVRRCPAETVLVSGAQWDLILVDPPYGQDAARWLALAAPCTRRALVIEHRHDTELPDACGALLRDRVRRYGLSALSIYRPGERYRAPAGLQPDLVVGDDLPVVEDEG
jgi:16S rRNA (guanine966-N2)-methyltransferase